jgi:hypothetical protein
MDTLNVASKLHFILLLAALALIALTSKYSSHGPSQGGPTGNATASWGGRKRVLREAESNPASVSDTPNDEFLQLVAQAEAALASSSQRRNLLQSTTNLPVACTQQGLGQTNCDRSSSTQCVAGSSFVVSTTTYELKACTACEQPGTLVLWPDGQCYDASTSPCPYLLGYYTKDDVCTLCTPQAECLSDDTACLPSNSAELA